MCEMAVQELWSFEYELVILYRITKKRPLWDMLYGKCLKSCHAKDEYSKWEVREPSVLAVISFVILLCMAFAALYNLVTWPSHTYVHFS